MYTHRHTQIYLEFLQTLFIAWVREGTCRQSFKQAGKINKCSFWRKKKEKGGRQEAEWQKSKKRRTAELLEWRQVEELMDYTAVRLNRVRSRRGSIYSSCRSVWSWSQYTRLLYISHRYSNTQCFISPRMCSNATLLFYLFMMILVIFVHIMCTFFYCSL